MDLAGRQHNVVARAQIRRLGFSARQIDCRIERGWLRAVHRGVYAVGRTALTREGAWMAATLAPGEGTALSHRSAAELWKLVAGCSSPVHVTVPGSGGRKRRSGLVVHRSRLDGEVARKLSVAVTKPPRTLIDFAEAADRRALERAADEAERLRLCTEAQLRRAINRHPGRCGAARLSALLGEHAIGTTATANDFEELLIGICDDFGISRPQCQLPIGRYRPDFVWPDRRLVVEADSWESHGTRKAFESDRRKDAELHALGWAVLRFTFMQMTREREWVGRTLGR